MSHGQVLQYDRPAALLTRPANPFISRLTGTGDRAMKLLALTTAGEAAEAGAAQGPTVAASATLRDVLSDLVWSGAPEATVLNTDGTPCGRLTLAGILAHGKPS
jgi:osmoprotectant transport system ATP-binding protein